MGNFNIVLLKPSSSCSANNFTACSYYPTISKPTRVPDNSASLIDNIFTNLGNVDASSKVNIARVFIIDVSDHFPIFLHCKLQSQIIFHSILEIILNETFKILLHLYYALSGSK